MKPGAASTASHSTRMTRSASRRHRSPSKTPAKKPNKRNFEDSSEGEEEVEIDELEEDEKPPVKKKKNNTRKRAATPKKTGGSADTNGEWTAVKRALLVEKLIDAGYKHLDLNEVASEVSCRTGPTS